MLQYKNADDLVLSLKRKGDEKMLTTKKEAQNFVISQLKKIPRWIKKENLSADEIRERIVPNLNFSEIRTWLKKPTNKLDLSKFLIGEKWNYLILYFILEAEDEDCHFFSNDELLDDSAQDRCLEIIEPWGVHNIQSMTLEQYLEESRKTA